MKFLNSSKRLFCTALLFGCAWVVPAHADTFTRTFISYSLATGDVSHTGTLVLTGTTDPFAANGIDVTTVTGDIDGTPLTLVSAPAGANSQNYVTVDGGFQIDNVAYTGGTLFDYFGLWVTDGTYDYNFYADPAVAMTGFGTLFPYGLYNGVYGPEERISYPQLIPQVSGETPEPSGLALFGTGVLAAAGFARRRFFRS